MENDGVEETDENGEKVVKSGTEVVMQGLTMLGELIAQQGQSTDMQLQKLAQIMAAPNEIIRDVDGRAKGARKVFNAGPLQ